MKIKGNRFVTSILAASMLSGTFFVPASAGELEGESAIAGMAVTLNNYYAGEETPDEAILDYLVPKAQATSEAESETETEEPKTVMAATVAVTSDASNVGLVSAAGYLNVREQPSTGSVTVGRLFSNCQVKHQKFRKQQRRQLVSYHLRRCRRLCKRSLRISWHSSKDC